MTFSVQVPDVRDDYVRLLHVKKTEHTHTHIILASESILL